MTDWWARSLAERPSDGLDQLAWADHTGWHVDAALPAGVVPTGAVWAWGPQVWAHWREEYDRAAGTRRVQGVMICKSSTNPDDKLWVAADVRVHSFDGKRLPSTHHEERFFRSEGSDATQWRGKVATVLEVRSPTRVDLVELSDEPAAGSR